MKREFVWRRDPPPPTTTTALLFPHPPFSLSSTGTCWLKNPTFDLCINWSLFRTVSLPFSQCLYYYLKDGVELMLPMTKKKKKTDPEPSYMFFIQLCRRSESLFGNRKLWGDQFQPTPQTSLPIYKVISVRD